MHKPLYSQKFELDLDLFWENKITCFSHKTNGLCKEYVAKYVPLLRYTPGSGRMFCPHANQPWPGRKPRMKLGLPGLPKLYMGRLQPCYFVKNFVTYKCCRPFARRFICLSYALFGARWRASFVSSLSQAFPAGRFGTHAVNRAAFWPRP